MILVKKLDGTSMYLNEDHIYRVEVGAKDQSTVYLSNGGHIISAIDAHEVVARIRSEKETLLHHALNGPGVSVTYHDDDDLPDLPGVTRLSPVRS